MGIILKENNMLYIKKIVLSICLLFLSGCSTISPPEYKFDVPREQFSEFEIDGIKYEIGFIYTVSERPKYADCLKNQYVISQDQQNWVMGGDLSDKYSERICIDHLKKLILVVYDAWLIDSQNYVITNVGKEVITCSNIYGTNSGRGFHLIEGDYRPRTIGGNDHYIYHNCTSFFFKEANFSKTGNVLSNIGSLGLNYALGNNPTYLVFSPNKVFDAAKSTFFEDSRKRYINNAVINIKRGLSTLNYFDGRSNTVVSKQFINALEAFLSDEGKDQISCNEGCLNIIQSDYIMNMIENALKRII